METARTVLLDLDDVDLASSASVLGSRGPPTDARSAGSPDGRFSEDLTAFTDLVDGCELEAEVDDHFGRRPSRPSCPSC